MLSTQIEEQLNSTPSVSLKILVVNLLSRKKKPRPAANSEISLHPKSRKIYSSDQSIKQAQAIFGAMADPNTLSLSPPLSLRVSQECSSFSEIGPQLYCGHGRRRQDETLQNKILNPAKMHSARREIKFNPSDQSNNRSILSVLGNTNTPNPT